MNLKTAAEWIAWAGVVIPLAALAWSAVFYVVSRRREIKHQEYQRFFEITNHLGSQQGSIASKMAAAYELRKYPEYKDVVLNICEKAEVEGAAAAMLKEELALTSKYMRALK